MSFRSSSGGSGGGGPMTLSQVPASPSFRASAVNAVAVIPLLSSTRDGHDNPNTHSSRSFQFLLDALNRYNTLNANAQDSTPNSSDSTLLVVPNSLLTRPGDWKYEDSPLKNFHWGHGCQRMIFFDGRPYNSRMAHDRLINHELTRNWIDLCPHRRTAAVIGVLNLRDCPDEASLHLAQQEWQQWAHRYSTPPYEVSAHGRDLERDFVVQKLFVFDSFVDSNPVDINSILTGASLVAFPPANNQDIMDNHMNVVVNDLAVAIVLQLEDRIRESDSFTKGSDTQPLVSQVTKARFFQRGKSEEEEAPKGSANLSINNLASVVSPDSKLAAREANKKNQPAKRVFVNAKLQNVLIKGTTKGSSTQAQLLTPLDDVWDFAELNPKDAQEMMRREIGRREKFAGDLSLLAGSPLDAYERYTKAAELCRTTCPDPLWYASAMEGCASAHIAMAEAGGFNVDDYLERSFQLPDTIMACAVLPAAEKSTTKQNMSSIVAALCDEALNVYCRHSKLACFRAELLLKLSWYGAEVEDTHLRCQWGMGEGCYGGDPQKEKRRWELASSTQLNFLELRNKHGEDVIATLTLRRAMQFSEYMNQAVAAGALDPVTRADVALRCASMCLRGLRPSCRPPSQERAAERMTFARKATFFTMIAAEAMSEVDGDSIDQRALALWIRAAKLHSSKTSELEGGNYAWATLRAVALHALAIQDMEETSEDAAIELLSLMGNISPPKRSNDSGLMLSQLDDETDIQGNADDTARSDDVADTASYMVAGESVVSAARTYVRETRAKVAQAQRGSFFSGTKDSSLLAYAQSKWVDDDPIPTILLPMAEFSEISESVLSVRSVWSNIKFEQCFAAQKQIMKEIASLRRKGAASSVPLFGPDSISVPLPIRITSIAISETDAQSQLEQVKLKPAAEKTGAMATFFNPYANKKGENVATLVPEEEERYILVKFSNNLSIPLEIPRCQLDFNLTQKHRVKAPAISFVIPGHTEKFAVQFPFMVLKKSNPTDQDIEEIFDIKGLHLTFLSRTFFLPLRSSNSVTPTPSRREAKLPDPAALYPRRDYSDKEKAAVLSVLSPQLQVVPPQPNLRLSFELSSSPIAENTSIPCPIADGEVCQLPKLLLSNDAGLSGLGLIDELTVVASGLPGRPQTTLVHLRDENSPKVEKKPETTRTTSRGLDATPLDLTAICDGLDLKALNNPQGPKGSISLVLAATSDMGAYLSSCTVKVTFKFRGKAPSTSLEVWRKRVIEVGVLRIKGPRVSSITFRPDLSWKSGYADLCHEKKMHTSASDPSEQANRSARQHASGVTEQEGYVASRLGMDPGVQVCGDKVVVVVSVANESSSEVLLSRPEGALGGFEGHAIDTLNVLPGVSAKIPIVLPRLERDASVCSKLFAATKLNWTTKGSFSQDSSSTATGGTMIPVNCRLRTGTLVIPGECLRTIVDKNPTFLSRLCKSPCSINVTLPGSDGGDSAELQVGKPMEVKVHLTLAEWIPQPVVADSNFTLEFYCARKGSRDAGTKSTRDYVWSGQVRKAIGPEGFAADVSHSARLLILKEGNYVLSACVSFGRKQGHELTKEVWWAEQAIPVRVQAATK
eukprot:Nitzschia sp. Nitz4//scaffold5_size260463//126788//131622//NITZ4_000982-RA/size260463-augustus-gene-0.33-mRNA-1//-1//CDS//3329555340//4392//frame0